MEMRKGGIALIDFDITIREWEWYITNFTSITVAQIEAC
jgi:hypothetical protein